MQTDAARLRYAKTKGRSGDIEHEQSVDDPDSMVLLCQSSLKSR